MREKYQFHLVFTIACLIMAFGQNNVLVAETGPLVPETTHIVTSHKFFFPSGYNGSSNCQACHMEQIDEVMDSVHFLWRSENPLVEFPGGGSHGMIDRACGLVGSNALINYYEQCGRCHVGDSLPFPDETGQFTADQKNNLDCLICHAAEGMYDANNDGIAELGELADDKPLVYDADRDVNMWHQDRRTEAAQSVGERVSNEACLRCHHHGQADEHYKRGTPYTPETDVHAAAGLLCTTCHFTSHHKIARGSRVTDMFAWERQDVDVRCENCHTNSPHVNTPIYNQHTDKIDCKTCHIPEVAGAQRRVWTSTLGATEGPESDVPVWNDATGQWEPYTEYDEGMTSPSYRWFAGGASMLAEPIANPGAFDMQPATRETLGAKILPFRRFISGQPMDGDPAFTMAVALTQMAPMLQMAGFMRPEGMTPEEEAMMSMFPNMLLFDRSDYFTNGNVAEAVSIGMAKQGAFMQAMDIRGMSRDDLIAMGNEMWSGQVIGLDLPNNPYAPGYLADEDPTTVTGSYITVSHAIKLEGALSCFDCHTENGRLDFAALGYSQDRQMALTNLEGVDHSLLIVDAYEGPRTCVKCHAKHAVDMFGSVHYQWDGPTPNVPNIEGNAGKGNDSFNTYCGAVNASRRAVCWKCHVGNGKVVTETADEEQLNNIDCLMCHQDAYKRKPAPTIPVGDYNQDFSVNLSDFAHLASAWDTTDDSADLTFDGKVNTDDVLSFAWHWLDQGDGQMFTFIDYQNIERTWKLPYEDASGNMTLVPDVDNMTITPLEAAQTVHMPTRMSCLKCHANAGGGDGLKRGDFAMASADAPVEADVHLSPNGANLTCQACHQTEDHKMLGRGLDLRVNDRPELLTCDSLDCHTSTPHNNDWLNTHTARVACQTCHISTYAKLAATETHRDWLDPHWVQGVYSGQGGYKPREYTASDLIPTYGWYNGQSEVYKLGQVPHLRKDGAYEIAAPLGDVSSEGSMVYPMKEHTTVAGMHDETGQMIPYSTTKYFFTGRFEDAIADGLAERNLTGDWSVVTGHTYQLLNHGVEPKENALTCGDCHESFSSSPVRMDLTGQLGFEYKTRYWTCSQCHLEIKSPEQSDFLEIHLVHVRNENIQCNLCHKFSRPERNLDDCTNCH